MDFQIIHFRDSENIFEAKAMASDLLMTVEHVFHTVKGKHPNQDLYLKLALNDMGWVNGNSAKILPGRQNPFKGFKHGVAIEANLERYDYLSEGLMRLQLGYDKGLIDTAILMITAKRDEKSPHVVTETMLREDVESFRPTISMPIAVCLYDFGNPLAADNWR
jgi:hypothetical protein